MPGSPLRQRIVTAAALVPLAVAAVLFLPTPPLAALLAAVVGLGAWEWAALAGMTGRTSRAVYVLGVLACMFLLWYAPLRDWFVPLMVPVALWWVAVTVHLSRIRAVESARGPDFWLLPAGLIVLVSPWAAMIGLHGLGSGGPALLLFLLVLIWVVDSAAFFSGRRWGRVKLAPALSPGKTLAGLYGAVVAAAACGLLLALGLGLDAVPASAVVVVCVLTALVSVVGDLYESLLKRRRGMKDSGALLPGHGGVLDRIDSLTAAAPAFALGMAWLEAGA